MTRGNIIRFPRPASPHPLARQAGNPPTWRDPRTAEPLVVDLVRQVAQRSQRAGDAIRRLAEGFLEDMNGGDHGA